MMLGLNPIHNTLQKFEVRLWSVNVKMSLAVCRLMTV